MAASSCFAASCWRLPQLLSKVTVDATNWRRAGAATCGRQSGKVSCGNRSLRGAQTQQILASVHIARLRRLGTRAVLVDLPARASADHLSGGHAAAADSTG